LYKLKSLILLVAMWMGFGAGALAQVPGPVARTENVTLSLAVEGRAAPNATIWLAVAQKIRPHWHTYWRNPGDSGLPTTIDWALPAGVSAGAIQWPKPSRFDIGPLVNLGFSDEAILLVPMTFGTDLPRAPLVLQAKVDWLVCEEICIPEQATVAIDLATATPDPALFERARAALPKSWPGTIAIEAKAQSLEMTLRGGPKAIAGKPYFFPDAQDAIDPTPWPNVTPGADGLTVSLPRLANSPIPKTLSGVIDLGDQGAFEIGEVAVNTITAASTAPPSGGALADPDMAQSTLQAAVFAFLGGLILNLMPCVLPILSMKALSLARASGSRAELRRDGLFFMAGVLVCFGAVAGSLLALKAGGEVIGWGFQLQSPPVVLALVFLMVAIGLNLFGLFEVPLSFAGIGQDLTQSGGAQGAFFTGVLAVLVASPCTAPFMGAALGFALTQPAGAAAIVFLALGLGFAAPFTALALSPALVRLIPRPGTWMVRFKEFLAFPMLATAIWLTWVLAQQTGPDGVVVTLSGGLMVGFLCWLVPKLSAPWNWAAALLGLAALAATAFQLQHLPPPSLAQTSGGFSPWSVQAVADAQAQGRPVFVDFTAAWCVTCQVNERVAFNNDETRTKFAQAKAVLLKADWTRRDNAITNELARFGRAGVPLYLLYPPKGGAPEVLPQILTPTIVQEALSRALSSSGASPVASQ
jgi:thiol:disulfide interchange protein DsbD